MPVHSKEVVAFVRRAGIARPKELAAIGVSRVALSHMVADGILRRDGWGLYSVPDSDMSEHRSFAEVGKRIPRGVICLFSALRFHDLTVQNPHEVWVAIEAKTWRPRLEYPPIRIVEYSGKAWTEGVEKHFIDGVPVNVTSVPKTIADCFKFRNKIGLDVAMEAMEDAWKNKKLKTDDLWHCAKVCRVLNVLRPYLDTLR